MAVYVSGKKPWAVKLKIECERRDCPNILEYGVDDLKISQNATAKDYAERDGKHEYRIICPDCNYPTTVGYALDPISLMEQNIP